MSGTDDYPCSTFVAEVTDYLEGAMPETQRKRLEAHLSICDGCERYLDQVRVTMRAVATLREDDIDPGAKTALMDAFRAWRSGSGTGT